MAFSFTKDQEWIEGPKRHTSGTFTNTGGSTGGAIRTGMARVDFMETTPTSTAPASHTRVTTDLPAVDGITIATTADVDGIWHAVGS